MGSTGTGEEGLARRSSGGRLRGIAGREAAALQMGGRIELPT